ncbi:MAG: hypothetical protein ACM3ST_01685 [Bdellovibrio bacteriovorus]
MYTNALFKMLIGAAAVSAVVAPVAGAETEIAYLLRINGSALVNKGEQYVDGAEGMPLSTGDRVMSLEDSGAVIQFADGCRYTMEENELFTIPSASPCAFAKGPSDRMSVVTLPPPPPTSVPPVAAIVPAAANLAWVPLAAAGLVAATAVLSDPDDDDPPPPISP